MSTRTGSARFGRVALVGVVGWIVRRFRRVRVPDPYRPIFDPGLDIATVVFSHVRCVKTRHSLARVSKLWRDASEPAAAYPRTFDFDAFPECRHGVRYSLYTRRTLITRLLDNDEALSLPYERVVGLLGAHPAYYVCDNAAGRGSVRLLKWARENNLDWSADTCSAAARNGHLPALQYLHENGCPWYSYTCTQAASNGHLPALQYLHENGCPWDWYTCSCAARWKHWDCLQYAVDNKCEMWEEYAENYAEHLR